MLSLKPALIQCWNVESCWPVAAKFVVEVAIADACRFAEVTLQSNCAALGRLVLNSIAAVVQKDSKALSDWPERNFHLHSIGQALDSVLAQNSAVEMAGLPLEVVENKFSDY